MMLYLISRGDFSIKLVVSIETKSKSATSFHRKSFDSLPALLRHKEILHPSEEEYALQLKPRASNFPKVKLAAVAGKLRDCETHPRNLLSFDVLIPVKVGFEMQIVSQAFPHSFLLGAAPR